MRARTQASNCKFVEPRSGGEVGFRMRMRSVSRSYSRCGYLLSTTYILYSLPSSHSSPSLPSYSSSSSSLHLSPLFQTHIRTCCLTTISATSTSKLFKQASSKHNTQLNCKQENNFNNKTTTISTAATSHSR